MEGHGCPSVNQWEIWSNEPSDTYLDIASRCLWWYVSCRMLPPCSQGDDKAGVWWDWGSLLECNFCICLSFQHAQREPTLQFESLTSFEALLETGIPNSKGNLKRNPPASHVGRPSTSTREWVWPCCCLVSQQGWAGGTPSWSFTSLSLTLPSSEC